MSVIGKHAEFICTAVELEGWQLSWRWLGLLWTLRESLIGLAASLHDDEIIDCGVASQLAAPIYPLPCLFVGECEASTLFPRLQTPAGLPPDI